MSSSLIFQFLYINVLNYYYFHTYSSTFFKNKKRKNKKTNYVFYVQKILGDLAKYFVWFSSNFFEFGQKFLYSFIAINSRH